VTTGVVNCGDGDQHVGLYASLDNWHSCFVIVLLFINTLSCLLITYLIGRWNRLN